MGSAVSKITRQGESRLKLFAVAQNGTQLTCISDDIIGIQDSVVQIDYHLSFIRIIFTRFFLIFGSPFDSIEFSPSKFLLGDFPPFRPKCIFRPLTITQPFYRFFAHFFFLLREWAFFSRIVQQFSTLFSLIQFDWIHKYLEAQMKWNRSVWNVLSFEFSCTEKMGFL